ncbi:hypothetical protein [Aliarcobacter butzleri]|uniref:hypothetical protein n=1 Tax=Aliarcobacter butzleri TaxID=28197 RepID=UPI00126A0D1B|nr:hypothetical protein [Aliarcobacter butzleri]
MSNEKKSIPVLLEQDLIVHNYIYELFLNGVSFTNYKKHINQGKFETTILDLLDSKDYVLSSSIYYLYHLIINDKIITNSSLNYLKNKSKDALAEVYSDVVSIIPLCSQIYLLIERTGNDDLKDKLFIIYRLCKKMFLIGQKLTSLYIKDGDYIREIHNGFLELTKNQIRSDIEEELQKAYEEIKQIKSYIEEKELKLFDIVGDLKQKLFFKYFTNRDKNRTSLVKIIKKPFMYWNDNRNNIMSLINLHFLEKDYGSFEKEIKELKEIELISTSLVFFFEYEEVFWKNKSYSSIALKFFMDNDSRMKYAYITKNEDALKDFMKKFYNCNSLESFMFKKGVKNLLLEITKNNNDVFAIFKEISKKLPLYITDNNFIISTQEKDDLIKDISIKSYEIFMEVLNDKS